MTEKDVERRERSSPSSSELHKEKGRRRRSVLRAQRRWIAGLCVAAILLGVAFGVVSYIVSLGYFEDLDGTQYVIKKKNDVYVICDEDGYTLDLSASASTSKGLYIYVTELGTEVEVDPETGACSIYSVVDTEEGEVIGTSNRVQMFKQISQDNTDKIEVSNKHGRFIFYRDDEDKFQIQGYEGTPYNQVIFSSLTTSCGYTLAVQKVQDPIKDENGAYTEYGLAEEKRTDKDGAEYDYRPDWYRITDLDGNSYTVFIGDEIPSGAGYYVKYAERDAVYIMNYSLDGMILGMYDGQTYPSIDSVLDIPIEDFVTPAVTYPMQLNDYFDVTAFSIFRGEDLAGVDEDNVDESDVDPLVSFSFWDLDDRTGTFYANTAYVMHYPEGYAANDIAIDATLQALYTMKTKGVVKLGVDAEDMKTYGLEDPEFVIYFQFNDIEHYLYISEETEDGTRYMNSAIYDFIVEIDRSELGFLEYTIDDWVADQYFSMNIAWAERITLEIDGVIYTFKLDNSRTDSVTNDNCSDEAKEDGTISSDNMTVEAFDSNGNKMNALSNLVVVDKKGFTWKINEKTVMAYDKNGEQVGITGAYYATNELGQEVITLSGYIDSVDNTRIYVEPNAIKIYDSTGEILQASYLRYGMVNFRSFFRAMLYSTKEDGATEGVGGLSEEEIAKILENRDDYDVRIKVETSYKDTVYDFKFYRYSERNALLTVNDGNGDFRVLYSFIEKIAGDAETAILGGKLIKDTDKYS